MKKNKSKHATGKAFTIEVCDAIRHHIGERKALQSQRKNAFEDRNAAMADKMEMTSRDSREYIEACRRHSESVTLIEMLDMQIKWHNNQVDELVNKADEPELDFMYDPPAAPAPKAAGQIKLADETEADRRPVGRPGKPRPQEPSPEMGADGHNEHLKAAIAELDVNERRKSLVAHFETIGGLVSWWEGYCKEDMGRALERLDGASEADLKAILKALKLYRSKHRSAMAEAEKRG